MKAVSVVEIFGPTIQGEGPDAGRRCVFVRFGGCDYQCSWCDSLHAVLPAEVRKAPRLTPDEIIAEIKRLSDDQPTTVVLSGGNPALHDLTTLADLLHDDQYRVVVETQGSLWKDWLTLADLVVVSPKPPSSKMVTNFEKLDRFVWNLWHVDEPDESRLALKVVVGDDADYEYALEIHRRYPAVPFYMSVLNPAGSDGEAFSLAAVLDGYRQLCERVASDTRTEGVRVMPQLHTLAWGSEMGR